MEFYYTICEKTVQFLYFCSMNETKKSVTFIVNPISGTHSKKALPELIEQYHDKDLFESRIVCTEYAGHASELGRQVAD